MDKINLSKGVRNEKLHRCKEERNILDTIIRRTAD
jgi:hypothetical protein